MQVHNKLSVILYLFIICSSATSNDVKVPFLPLSPIETFNGLEGGGGIGGGGGGGRVGGGKRSLVGRQPYRDI